MMDVLALTMGGPLMLLFGIMIAAVVGAAGGYVIGTNIGRTPPETPLPTTLRLTREHLATTMGELEKGSRKLTAAQRPETAGSAIVLSRRVADLSNSLGRLGRKAQHEEGKA